MRLKDLSYKELVNYMKMLTSEEGKNLPYSEKTLDYMIEQTRIEIENRIKLSQDKDVPPISGAV